ncbi:MAG: hypothetical protein ABS62_11750 [Microbacterium sp. SCN 70-200]|uniref:hypothetical protein n=1 Tax=unclassified Microbacterium TaxID=2609290 RepID=UPI00086C315A|nr:MULTISPECIES: hypothetical protein [unclassified Microbacterium]MBN9215780.1 hypothetical protein [Microbacterium sp.]ODT39939.1 MAG: hypothetical protein ABS62_11750 [Microbacterium sp. SCN 70-200]OJV81962.1 MAG: hypothetical protein BGO46_08340 [Microbacterium sp. 70-16]
MTLHADFDRDLWVYVPTEWPWEGFDSLEEWSGTLVGALSEAYGYDTSMREWLTATVQGLSRSADENEHRFAYLSRPHEAIGIASIYELPARPDTPLEELVGVGDPRATRPVVAAPFSGGRLGAGLSATRHVTDDDGTVSVVTHWVWRLGERDVLMIVGDFDLARFEALRADYDTLARAIGMAD